MLFIILVLLVLFLQSFSRRDGVGQLRHEFPYSIVMLETECGLCPLASFNWPVLGGTNFFGSYSG